MRGQSHTFNADNQDVSNTYDGNGNPTLRNGQALTFDPENPLASSMSGLTAGHTDDGLRAWKQGSSGRTYFLYDGSQPICELNGSGNLTAVNDFGADGVWARHTTTTDWFYTFDPQGCLSQKVGRDGSVLCSSLYDAQGHEATTDTHPDPFSGYGGQFGYYADWETSGDNGGSCLYLLGHRFYDPNAGRFLNRDPISYNGGVNLYGYTGNNPVNRADPRGTSWMGTIVGIGVAGTVAILITSGIVIATGGVGLVAAPVILGVVDVGIGALAGGAGALGTDLYDGVPPTVENVGGPALAGGLLGPVTGAASTGPAGTVITKCVVKFFYNPH